MTSAVRVVGDPGRRWSVCVCVLAEERTLWGESPRSTPHVHHPHLYQLSHTHHGGARDVSPRETRLKIVDEWRISGDPLECNRNRPLWPCDDRRKMTVSCIKLWMTACVKTWFRHKTKLQSTSYGPSQRFIDAYHTQYASLLQRTAASPPRRV
ncbi:uncharacterized protein LY79DRAFT_199151 [Colletotrichum navitas]|uniref:Uncharacterized protein n=1 Tax=Colletotrichum navitas TaxID=681940 RepID=A0AAD8PZD1_9PEZI|nr:uncharacterized protein LY79DRAFT_199151 [Colletotrichum navitas]KAK1590751.1 hypothetical protein LY79DRAFT_199151 [Colletotrichum navitas]